MKGPDNTLKFPGNGRVIYLCNGKMPNGKIRTYVASPISNGHVSISLNNFFRENQKLDDLETRTTLGFKTNKTKTKNITEK